MLPRQATSRRAPRCNWPDPTPAACDQPKPEERPRHASPNFGNWPAPEGESAPPAPAAAPAPLPPPQPAVGDRAAGCGDGFVPYERRK